MLSTAVSTPMPGPSIKGYNCPKIISAFGPNVYTLVRVHTSAWSRHQNDEWSLKSASGCHGENEVEFEERLRLPCPHPSQGKASKILLSKKGQRLRP